MMHKTKFLPPYDENGRTNFKLRQKPGVYLINQGNETVYVGHSAYDVYKTMYRHFQRWDDPKQYRAYYSTKLQCLKVRVVYCKTATQAQALERGLIMKLQPRDNIQKFELFKNEQSEKAVEKYNTCKIGTDDDCPF